MNDCGKAMSWFLFIARLDVGAHIVCTLLKTDTLPKTLVSAMKDA